MKKNKCRYLLAVLLLLLTGMLVWNVLLTQEVKEEPQQEETDKSQDLETQLAEASSKASSAENLMLAYQAMDTQDLKNAAQYLKNVQEEDLSGKMKAIYQTVNNTINPPQEQPEDTQADSGEGEYDSSYDSGYDSGAGDDY